MLAIPAPKLWTPRRGSWWRLPRFDSLEMAHLKKSAATGHLLKTATGHLSKGCGGIGDLCYCVGETARVVLSGVTSVTSCEIRFGLFRSKISAAIDGTYDLPIISADSITCVYLLTTGLTFGLYNDDACTDLSSGPFTCEMRLTVYTISGQIVLRFGGGSYLETLFYSDGTEYIATCESTDISNLNTDTNGVLGYGGSANISIF